MTDLNPLRAPADDPLHSAWLPFRTHVTGPTTTAINVAMRQGWTPAQVREMRLSDMTQARNLGVKGAEKLKALTVIDFREVPGA